MKILWLTWKDRTHPQSGGAETVASELARRLVADGHEVTFLTSRYRGAPEREMMDGYEVIRVGGRVSVYWKVYRYYRKHLSGKMDLVIDEMNTMPFFAALYVRERTFMFVHQLCREIWFYQLPFPLSLVGYLLEPLYLRLLNGQRVVTVSESTKRDLVRYGFLPEKISVISEGIDIDPVSDPDTVAKQATPTMLCLGSVRAMKRTLDAVSAFELAKAAVPDLKLIIAGDTSGSYGSRVLGRVARSKYAGDIEVRGRVTVEEKMSLMRGSHFIAVSSVKEGWGLVVTEAASQGTPAVVYDVDGLRDSVRDGETGIIAKENTPKGLADAVAELLADKDCYESLRKSAWEWSKEVNFEHSAVQFKEAIARYV